jgi:predicted permease
MNLVWMTLLTVLLAAAAFYAQLRIPTYTASRRNILITRAILITVGIASGIVSSSIYGRDSVTSLLAFLSGFGVVHVPAAFILLIKRGRGAAPT